MSSSLLIPIAGIVYTAVFAAMGALRREGPSLAFVVQSLAITAVFSVLNLLGGSRLHPLPFLLVLYLLSMRVRILVDLAGILASRGRLAAAERLYRLALGLLPSPAERFLLALNRGVCRLQVGDAASAASMLSAVLESDDYKAAGAKYQSAAHYNLGIACSRQGEKAAAAAQMRRVIELWPVSDCARRAEAALRQLDQG